MTEKTDEVAKSCISGVLFFRSVRSSFASLSLATVDSPSVDIKSEKREQLPILVRLQFKDQLKEFRSLCRRYFKLGDILDIKGGIWEESPAGVETAWNGPRMIINLSSIEQLKDLIVVRLVKYWDMPDCQMWQKKYFPTKDSNTRKKKNHAIKGSSDNELGGCSECIKDGEHGNGTNKRLLGEYVANFLLHAMMNKFLASEEKDRKSFKCVSKWTEPLMDKSRYELTHKKVIEMLNSGSGVVDVAGGSGHVSMALGLASVQSTIVDPRPSVGKLPKKDRKIWNRALKSINSTRDEVNDQLQYCQPVVPFNALRAWFGHRPDGVDLEFRQPDNEDVPICAENLDLFLNCSAIVALHPDEATGDIVDLAVKHRKPFVIVPCCVFCRLFPLRRKPSSDQVVSTYEDLLEYLLDKDASIQSTRLPFQGKNTVLWSVF